MAKQAVNNLAFWMVWCPMGHNPQCRHANMEAANREAKRLAKMNPGMCYYVVEALTLYKLPVALEVEETQLKYVDR